MTGPRHISDTNLLAWYQRSHRDLPWREPGVSPWQILVSEFMLQQTPAARVLAIWPDWVRRWPTPSATATASTADVLRAWGKLGYPRRAKRLHECATVIARDHNDVVPDDIEILVTLPGVGSYAARAVACFAYRQRVPVVDTKCGAWWPAPFTAAPTPVRHRCRATTPTSWRCCRTARRRLNFRSR